MLYQNSSENVYGFLKLDSLKKLVKEGLPDSVEIANVLATKSLSLKYKDNTYKYVSAGIVHPTIMNKHAVLSLDISPAGQLGVSGGSDGLLRIWESATGVVRRDFKGHFGDVTCTRFLPSGQVIMSGASDFQIKIWDLTNGECGATLKGHKGTINALDFINRGRNFISSSRDGSCKLWDCASQSEITTIHKGTSPVTDCAIAVNTTLSNSNSSALDEKDFDTQGKIGAFVSSSGLLRVFDVRTRQSVFSQTVEHGLKCCCIIEDGFVVLAGSDSGHLVNLDLRKTSNQIEVKKLVDSTISSITRDGQWFSTVDGGCFSTTQHLELTGADCDPIYKVISSTDGKKVYTACRDGKVRQYSV
ncbi:predicted protein [Naegleria gruberi]|uniref:Predicted protein n=1 Tax=Naegleria gruberi TaxID=5762 RepID=D2V0Q5_NAEGR|nr:uncharacterized protein NAEGRDRAFT_62378 [Naegleria gruberi]EFC49558.1 predicted protein [Naegleria gruberi]|eukprot:XP_002682302.1 predicted protein [Naegleria gruberi strain NEG-M]